MNLLTTNGKLAKANSLGWTGAGIALRPHTLAGLGNLCPRSTAGCRERCIGVGSLNNMPLNIRAQTIRADLFLNHPKVFERMLEYELDCILIKAKNKRKVAIRLNVQSDCIRVYHTMALYPQVQFYDYTKLPEVIRSPRPKNYHLTFSRSEKNEAECINMLREGVSVAVPFSGNLPKTWHGYRVVNGDAHDLTFLHPAGSVIGLRPKNHATKENSRGFIV